jgi:hypothetical protein
MQFWNKIIGAVQNLYGYAALALLVILSTIYILVYQPAIFYIVIILVIILCFYSLLVILVLSKLQTNNILKKESGLNIDSQIKIYPNIQSAFSDMTPIIEQSLSSLKVTNVVVMGLTLYQMWEYMKNFINKSSIEKMNITFCMVDSSSPMIRDLGNNWNELSDGFYNSIQKYMKAHQDTLNERSINIKIKRYKHIPIIHGILINDEHLFLSYTSWTKKDQMQGASNDYFYYNINNAIGKQHIKIFKNWIDHINRNKCDDLCMKSLKPEKSH